MSVFSTRLREVGQRKGVTQDWMAKRLNIHRTSYTKYETATAELSLQMFRDIVRLLDVDPMDLLE